MAKDFDENQKYPLVIFLHGAGERGDDLDRVYLTGLSMGDSGTWTPEYRYIAHIPVLMYRGD